MFNRCALNEFQKVAILAYGLAPMRHLQSAMGAFCVHTGSSIVTIIERQEKLYHEQTWMYTPLIDGVPEFLPRSIRDHVTGLRSALHR